MDEATYKQWWPLHRRAAVGETLSAEEQAVYEAGTRQLDAEEAEQFRRSEERLQQQHRQQWQAMIAEREKVLAEYNALKARTTELEAGLDEPILRAIQSRIADFDSMNVFLEQLLEQKPITLTEKQKAAIALIDSWRREDVTDDATELARRDAELKEFILGMNANRADEGRPPVYP